MFGWLKRSSAVCNVAPEEAHGLAAAGEAVLVDIREDSEWRAGHVPGAVHLPLSRLAAGLARLPKDKRVILYCLSGGRSGRALAECGRLGVAIDSHMAGGIAAWQRAGLPIER